MSLVIRAIELANFPIAEVVSGGARGIDQLAECWAAIHGVPFRRFPAKWRRPDGTNDKLAGLRRNSEMARYAQGLIAIWDGHSPGTKHMIEQANFYKLRAIYVYDARPGAVNLPKQWS